MPEGGGETGIAVSSDDQRSAAVLILYRFKRIRNAGAGADCIDDLLRGGVNTVAREDGTFDSYVIGECGTRGSDLDVAGGEFTDEEGGNGLHECNVGQLHINAKSTVTPVDSGFEVR